MFNYILYKLKNSRGEFVLGAIAVLAMMFTVICGALFINNNAASAGAAVDDFIQWVQDNRSELITHTQQQVDNGYLDISDVDDITYKWVMSSPLSIEIVQAIYDFWASRGTFSEDGLTISSSDTIQGVSNFNVFSDYCYNHFYTVNGGTRSFSDFNSGLNYYLIRLNSDRPYVVVAFYAGSLYFLPSTSAFLGDFDFVNLTAAGEVYCNSPYCGGFSLPGNGSARLTRFLPSDIQYVGYVKINTAISNADSSITDGSVTLGYTARGRDFADDPSTLSDDLAERGGVSVTHYENGSTSVQDGTGVVVRVVVDANGGVTVDDTSTADYDDTFTEPTDDVYKDVYSAATGQPSFISDILRWLRDFWRKFFDNIVNALKKVFLPDAENTDRLIGDIRQVFVSKFGFTDFEFDNLIDGTQEPQDFWLRDYSAGGLPQITAKIVDVQFLKTAAQRFRALIRGVIAFLLLIYNFNQLFAFIGQAGVSFGIWQSGQFQPRQSFDEAVWDFYLRGGGSP